MPVNASLGPQLEAALFSLMLALSLHMCEDCSWTCAHLSLVSSLVIDDATFQLACLLYV